MAAELLDPKIDYVFKRLFAEAPALTRALINDLRPHAPPLASVEVKNPSITPQELTGKLIVLDVLARDDTGRAYNIEMQVRRYANWSARSVYYLARLLSSQLAAGEEYRDVGGAVGINVLDFDLFPAMPQALWCFELRDAHHPQVALGDELQLNVLELPKAERLWWGGDAVGVSPPLSADALSAAKAWATFFRHWQEAAIMADVEHEPVRQAMDRIRELSADEETRRMAFLRERAIRDEKAVLLYARQEGHAEGLQQGLEQGLERGIERGLERGLEQGLEQGTKAGRVEGELMLLQRLLTRRFGPLPTWAEARLRAASHETLSGWADAVLDAKTLEGVLGPAD